MLGPVEACFPAKGDDTVVRQEWVGGWRNSLLEAKGRGDWLGVVEGRPGMGTVFEI